MSVLVGSQQRNWGEFSWFGGDAADSTAVLTEKVKERKRTKLSQF